MISALLVLVISSTPWTSDLSEPLQTAVRVLPYDRNYAARLPSGDVHVLLACGAQDGVMCRDAASYMSQLKMTLAGRRVVFIAADVGSEAAFDTAVSRERAVAIVAPVPLPNEALQVVKNVAANNQLATMSLDETQARAHFAVGVKKLSDGRFKMLINVAAATDEGLVFDAGLLRVSEVVGR